MIRWTPGPTTIALGLVLVTGMAPASAQVSNPHDGNPGAIRAGRALFARRCAECHGADARGISGPDLTLLWSFGTTDDRVFRTVKRGVPGSIMPSSDAPDDEIWAIVSYLKSVGTVTPDENLPGDPNRGHDIFRSTCERCHRVNGRGGRLGPDLSFIGQTRARPALVQAIRDPGASVRVGYRSVTLTVADGGRVRGANKGEDAFSIQVLDTDERLQGYLKSDLRDLSFDERSLMPVFGPERLDDGELDDLIKFLSTLRRSDSGQ